MKLYKMNVKIKIADEVTVKNAIYSINEILGSTENFVFFSRAVYVTESHKILIKKTKKNKIIFYVEARG
jgi:isocitrate dehydrogenase